MSQDEHHLQLLAIFHYVVGGLTALVACCPLMHVAIGIIMLVAPQSMESHGEGPPAFVALIFIVIPGTIILAGWALAICMILTGRFLSRRRHHLFCLVIAGIECLMMPFGTVLGVFSIIVLTKESVREMFLADDGMQTMY